MTYGSRGAVVHAFADAAAARMAGKLLHRHSPHEIAEAIEVLIDVLDLLGGDPDSEDGDEDRCGAHDDDPAISLAGGAPGDPDDAEDDLEDRCLAGDDGCGAVIHGGQVWFGSKDDEADGEGWEQPITLNPEHQEQEANHG